jgi:hypothetical protein
MPREKTAKQKAEARKAAKERVRVRRIEAASFNRKLERASNHIEDLRKITDEWLGTDAYTVVKESDPKTGKEVLRAKITDA